MSLKTSRKNGMTLAETLIVIAIMTILFSVAFIAIFNHQRNLAQTERDGIAKELFISAQNHLTLAKGQGYFGTKLFGSASTVTEDAGKSIYYYVVDEGTVSKDGQEMFNQMLPDGSMEESIRSGGSYIIRYQPNAGKVLDVFYCTVNASPEKYNHNLSVSEFGDVMALRGEEHKAERKNYGGSVLGWYGNNGSAGLEELTLNGPPAIKVHNEEKLTVEITDPNYEKAADGALLRLMIEGKTSGAKKAIQLSQANSVSNSRIELDVANKKYTVILDDITESDNELRFNNLNADNGRAFSWGENLKLQAVAYSTTKITKILYSVDVSANSLFGGTESHKDTYNNDVNDTVLIGNIRHLENLGNNVSIKGNYTQNKNDEYNEPVLNISKAKQTSDFSWRDFQFRIAGKDDDTYKELTDEEKKTLLDKANAVRITGTTEDGAYLPINTVYALDYDGCGYSISDVKVNTNGNAGLFGSSSYSNKISNLELIDFNIAGTDNAGTLAGAFTGNTTITNVLARNSKNSKVTNVTSNGSSGGLVGNMENGAVQYSAASVIVNGATAGGLVGTMKGNIKDCYSGGHTKDGSYNSWVSVTGNNYDVTGTTAGGLVGTTTGNITSSYSTCSVSGTTAGGLAGQASETISNCYAVGLVDKTAETRFAFVASGNPTLNENLYLGEINKAQKTENGKTVEEQLQPSQGYETSKSNVQKVKAIDLNTDTYNDFVNEFDTWNDAKSYDYKLVNYYNGKYCFRTVDELDTTKPDGFESWDKCDYFIKTHYGDWPSSEVFFINN